MGFSGQEYWMGLPFASLGGLPYLGTEPCSPALQEVSLPFELQQIQQGSPLPFFHVSVFLWCFLLPASHSMQVLSSMIRDSTQALGRESAES